MPAAKKKPKARTTAKRKAAKKPRTVRAANGYCKGDCRIRTKGMRVGDERRRISGDGKKLKIIRVA